MNDKELRIKTVAELAAENVTPDILFWVGCAGSFDDRAKKVTQAFASILTRLSISYAVLGAEENCTGDPARRAGNEFGFQMLAQQNIAILNSYGIKKIVTACPHCFNILKNEYPKLGGNYEVLHHSTFLQQLINEGKLNVKGDVFKGKRITFHDSCYLGRANAIYEAPREVIKALDVTLVEMELSRSKGLCCGAGGAQMWKEDEEGNARINNTRAQQAKAVKPNIVAVACPFCNTMLGDGISEDSSEQKISVLDIAEMIDQNLEE